MTSKLVLINGQVASGKSSVGKALLNDLSRSAYIDGDALMSVNPFGINDKLDALAIKNLVSLINNYSEEGYKYIIVSGLIRNQKLLDNFLSKLSLKVDVLFVWLRAAKEVLRKRRLSRKRDGADNPEHHEFIDKLIPDANSFVIKDGSCLDIDTSTKTIEEVVAEIKARLV
ncbi:MAG: hypothetical protein Q7S16_05620 [bacterium]|nr:hypothetical protein [bacterium]